jgi:hypothetical protein
MSARRFVSRLTIAVGLAMICWCAPAPADVVHPYISSFGSFAHVDGVAVDQSTGDVYVFDAADEEILKYTATGEPAEFSSTKTNAITGVGKGYQDNAEIAIDSSTGPASGDIYVVNYSGLFVYNAAGEKIGALTQEAGKPWGSPCGIAVDPSGNVYVGLFYTHLLNRYTPTASPVTDADYSGSLFDIGADCQIAVGSAGEAYVDDLYDGPITRYDTSQFTSLEVPAIGTEVETRGSTLAVDPADDHVYVDNGVFVEELGAHGEPSEEPLSTFGSSGEGAIEGSEGIAVDQTSGDVYVSNGKGGLSVFGPAAITPTVVTSEAADVAGHTATLRGSVNPEGSPVAECRFEYGSTSSYGQSAPCSTSPGSGKAPVTVTASVAGLKSGTTYRYRLVAVDANGSSVGFDEVLTTGSGIVTGGASNVSQSGGTLEGTVDPEGLAVTECEFEYGPTVSYGQSVPCANDPGDGTAPVAVTGSVTGLVAKTIYHYRIATTDATGQNLGPDKTFTTEGPLSTGLEGLPDGRVYELVSPTGGADEVYEPEAGGEFANVETQNPFQAAADGNGIAYIGAPPRVGGNEDAGYLGGNQYLARRAGGGAWAQADISPSGVPSALFEGFSDDLSVGFLDSLEALSPDAPGWGAKVVPGGSWDVLYSTSTTSVGDYAPAFSVSPPNRTVGSFGTANINHPGSGGISRRERVLEYAGASSDSTHLLFEANDALTPNAEGGPAGRYSKENNLYESVGGQLRLVNVLPDGSTKANASFGAFNPETINGFPAAPDFSHVISADGSRVFWTDLNTGHIYVRENGTKTTEVSSAGKYWTATSDGSEVFYTNGDLYRYEVENGHTADLTPGVEVKGVIGASEDGEYIYYVSSSLDLDLWHNGQTIKIKTLSNSDNDYLAPFGGQNFAGDWLPGFANRMAEVSSDGRGVVFMSTEGERSAIGHVEVYDAETGQLYCASCGSGGSKGFVPMTYSDTYLKRWISEGGGRVFFDSKEALVPQDANGRLDAYEWERPGVGSCTSSKGCIYLLSGGTSTDESYFADASASGNDAFIVTRAKLLPEDTFENNDMYDARVDGYTPIAAPACTGTGCQGLPGAPPIFATPSSVTFEGVGNFAVPVPAVKAKQKPKNTKHRTKAKKRRRKTKHGKTKNGSKSSRRVHGTREHERVKGMGGQS